jgi:long-chain fatty acid transport protein
LRDALRRCLAGFTLLASTTTAAGAAGFSLGAQGARAMGTAGAFTAVADDPSAVFFNAGAVPLVQDRFFTLGAAAQGLQSAQYQGLPPGPGAATTGEQKTPQLGLSPHAYLLLPFGQRARFGLGVDSPFGFQTSWRGPTSFAGRFSALESELRTLDLNPSFSLRIGSSLGLGAGVIFRLSDLSLNRHVQGINPFTGATLDVGSLQAGTDYDYGWGWNVGILDRIGSRFSWGLSYRSAVDVQYKGALVLTQIPTGDPQLDRLNAATLPFGKNLPLTAEVNFPDTLTLGLAVGFSDSLTWMLDVSHTGWSRFDGLTFTSTSDPTLTTLAQGTYKDSFSYRTGLRYTTAGGSQWRLGAALEQSPQPGSSTGPFLADADHYVYALGWGLDWLDIALQWHQYTDRATVTNFDNINGRYRKNAWTVAVSATAIHRR